MFEAGWMEEWIPLERDIFARLAVACGYLLHISNINSGARRIISNRLFS